MKNIASSGEISRIVLAIKNVLAEVDIIPIVIFDEIDINIGGEIATLVGQELLELSKNHQVICISHLPQVASYAEHHIAISKRNINNRTYSFVEVLTKDNRIKEIARMLGETNSAIGYAKKLLSTSCNL